MLAIRLKRTGRTGHTQFRLIAQDKRFSPFSGKIAQYLGSYDPHTKVATIDKEKVSALLDNGAQPSPRVAKLLSKEGVKLPDWVAKIESKKKATRNPEKLRKNRPAEPKVAKPVEAATAEPPAPADEDAASTPEAETPTTESVTEAEADEVQEPEVKSEPAKNQKPAEAEVPADEAKPEGREAKPEPEANSKPDEPAS